MLPLRTTRLLLRDFVLGDLAAVHAYGADPDVVRFMFWGPRTEDESRAYLDRMLAAQRASPRTVYELAIVRREDFALVGGCDLTLDGRGEGDLGYVLARSAWGNGYATEACRALLALGFETLGLRRVFATCDPKNVPSQRVMQRLGMLRERELRRHVHAKGRFWDSYEYAIYPP
jgi:ribosomal-protein-alanine N-acetyltransferase